MKRIDIEAVLRWTFLDELPKARAVSMAGQLGVRLGWGQMGMIERLGTLIDDSRVNQYGLVTDYAAEVGPSRDALTVYAAVESLDDCVMVLPEGWDPLEDMDGGNPLIRAAVERGLARITRRDDAGQLVLTQRPSALIKRHVILGTVPDTTAEQPVERVVSEHGKPKWFRMVQREVPTCAGGVRLVDVEVDGRNARTKRPYPDAYRKLYLDPDPVDCVIGRAEYELWRSALDALVEMLAGKLAENDVSASRRPRRPWLPGEAAAPRVLVDLSSVEARSAIRRGRLGTRLSGRKNQKPQAA